MTALVGCSGYHYEEWRGTLYPADLSKEDFLRFYALFFPVVELDYSYAHPPTPWHLEALAAMVPRSFRFIVKVPRCLTQEILEDWSHVSAAFGNALRVRGFIDRLAAVVLHVPRRFRHTDPHRVYLGELTKDWMDLPLILEFHSSEWLTESVTATAERRGIALAVSDELPVAGKEDRRLYTVADRALLRMRGRLSESDDGKAKFGDYAYSDYELAEWKDAVLAAEASARECFVIFNNFGDGNAVKDARRFQALLDGSRDRLPGIG